jgi:serine/threonine protein kinase
MQPLIINPTEILGQQWGQYSIEKFLDVREYYQPFVAKDQSLGRQVLLLVLKEEIPSKASAEYLYSEVRRLSLLRHPNISQIIEFKRHDRFLFIVVEYIEGVKLTTALKQAAKDAQLFPLNLSLRVVYSISLALAYAHKRNIIHGEVNPESIIIEDSGRVVLSTFGLKQIFDSIYSRKTEHSQASGYTAPELRSGQPVSAKSDIYSLGVIFYQLVTGHLPFEDGGELIPPRQWDPDLPESVDGLLLKCIAADSSNRYNTMDEFVTELTNIRLEDKTAKLPTALLVQLSGSRDELSSWKAPESDIAYHDFQVCLNFMDTGQIIYLDSDREYIIGRKHRTQTVSPDIDLSPYSEYDWGISRLHAKVSTKDERVIVTDIGSSNGTWHAGNRLESGESLQINHGDILYLGKLKIQVLVYS